MLNPQQRGPNNRGIEWTHVFGYNTGFTWNPIGGCLHACRWRMADGSIARCYAEEVADRLRSATFYPNGFAHHYWSEDRLSAPLELKKPAGIFLDSMSDIMGHWVPADEIRKVLAVCRKASWHVFFLLTKNAPRLREFDFPPNVWVGVSTPPTFMWGKELSPPQRAKMMHVALNALGQVDVPVRWLSAEPLSFDISPLVESANLQWVVIGAATQGTKTFQPRSADVQNLLKVCDRRQIPIFFKGNLKAYPWREDYPIFEASRPEALPTQAALF
jgi:protein gp37